VSTAQALRATHLLPRAMRFQLLLPLHLRSRGSWHLAEKARARTCHTMRVSLVSPQPTPTAYVVSPLS
jgi:hypothetical protein|tara:strand:+ start:263 stop:466 length:204 start_codon:yes stop_codon:yes gene_type:complete